MIVIKVTQRQSDMLMENDARRWDAKCPHYYFGDAYALEVFRRYFPELTDKLTA